MKSISVIVPVYNTAEYLPKCLNSILRQSYMPLEMILVDDGSTDGSGMICDEYASNYPEMIRVIHQNNQGSAAARNVGINLSRGEYLSFIDSDDYIEPDMFERLIDILLNNHADMAVGEMLVEKVDGKSYCRVSGDILFCWSTEEALLQLCSYRYLHVSFCPALFKKHIIGELRFPEGKRCEDYYLLYQVVAACKKIAYCSTPFYHYVQRGQSNSRTQDITLAPIDASFKQLEFITNNFPKLIFAAETDCLFAHIGIYTAYIRFGVPCPEELLKHLQYVCKRYLRSLKQNMQIPLIKKLQAVMFCYLPQMYKFVIKRTEHR